MHRTIIKGAIRIVPVFCLLSFIWVFLQPFTTLAGEKETAEATTDLLAPCQAQYEKIMALTRAGQLPAESGEKARQYWLALRKYMIQSDATLAVLRLEAQEKQGAGKGDSLDAILRTADERARTLLQYQDNFDRLLPGRQSSSPEVVSRMQAISEESDAAAATETVPAPELGRPAPSPITITFDPENLADGDQFME
jgi:hypothetical protein